MLETRDDEPHMVHHHQKGQPLLSSPHVKPLKQGTVCHKRKDCRHYDSPTEARSLVPRLAPRGLPALVPHCVIWTERGRLEQLVFLADLTEWLSFNATLKPLYIFWLPPRLSQTLQKLSEKFV
ncbi:hypothetical protein O3P69_009848 [Scylla paramamosain]|uniref:Uncharacterized protein n=1 Tax=Scylla paramamosain TaxID=85552 RepID=A0AAW0SNJ7_SCYPA